VVSNHLSYLDILLYSSVQPFVMVAKTEVRGWPLLGWLTAKAGTVYVERGGGPKTYPAVNAAMAEAYRSGLPVLFFPEGTTTDGAGVLPFRRGLFHSVLNGGVALRTAALRYSLDPHEVNGDATVGEDVCWWGDMEFTPHMFRFLGLRGLSAQIRFGEGSSSGGIGLCCRRRRGRR
jgi:1-acyl-sn-glycerol-3-phosphate acyltransferase